MVANLQSRNHSEMAGLEASKHARTHAMSERDRGRRKEKVGEKGRGLRGAGSEGLRGRIQRQRQREIREGRGGWRGKMKGRREGGI